MSDSPLTGNAFAPDLPDGRVAGVFSVDADTIPLAHANGMVSLPRSGLCLRVDGNVDLFAHLTHPEHPGVALVSRDLAILEHPSLAGDPAFIDTSQSVSRSDLSHPPRPAERCR